MIYYLSIGSNLGDRHAVVQRAVEMVSDGAGGTVASAPIETAPWGYDSDKPFINIVVKLESEMTPLEVLDRCQAVERTLGSGAHRDDAGNYIDRVVDIDIIAADNHILHSPRLTLPHPLMHRREFVLRPLAAIAPGWLHPVYQLTPAQLLARCDKS